jgi:hypothetical protein
MRRHKDEKKERRRTRGDARMKRKREEGDEKTQG